MLWFGPLLAAEHTARAGETLWSIARAQQSRYGKASVAQVAWGLVRSNPEAFPDGPRKLRQGTRLLLPSKALVAETAPDVAGARVKSYYAAFGQKAPPLLAASAPASPAPQQTAAAPADAPTPPASGAATDTPLEAPAGQPLPTITGIELLPAMGGEVRQWIALAGSGFEPGAKLMFFDVSGNRALTARIPASVAPARIEYQARFGDEPSLWRVAVRNPNGAESAPFEFKAGPGVMLVLPDRPPGTPVQP